MFSYRETAFGSNFIIYILDVCPSRFHERTDYKDEGHLNGAGAEKVSKCIGELICGDIANPFYDTFEEKVRNNPDGTWREIWE